MKKKMEFSKKIALVLTAIEAITVAFCCWMVYKTQDMECLSYLIPSVSATCGTGIAFYYNKAKLENKIKLMKSLGVEPSEQSFEV